jgi:hypothetical protein
MERESFESEEIGAILRESFISIKVDREERPDVDKVYMTFIQVRRIAYNIRYDIIIFLFGVVPIPPDTLSREYETLANWGQG